MGVQFEALDRKNRRVFDLDKGNWFLSGIDGGKPMTVQEVRAGIVRVHEDRYGKRNDVFGEEHATRTAVRLWAFCEVAGWDVELYSDAGDYSDDAMAGWPMVGARCAGDFYRFDPDPCEEQMRAAEESATAEIAKS